MVSDQSDSWESKCPPKNNVSQQIPRMQDYQFHSHFNVNNLHHEGLSHVNDGFNRLLQEQFDDLHQLQKITESGAYSCNPQQRVWH